MYSKNIKVVADATGAPINELIAVSEVYPFALSAFLADRVKDGTYSEEALRQFAPDARELMDVDGYTQNPTGEAALHPEKAIVQTYSNRLAITLTQRCLTYCRFCFRKQFVGFPENEIADSELRDALEYVARHQEIEDILLSGGDPLALPNRRLIPFLQELIRITHVKVIRIDSRANSIQPSRIDAELVDFLATDDRFWYYAHMNHPDDIDHPEVISAVRRLLSARVPVLNQSVILAGVNDDPKTMLKLMKLCYENKVIPYNLYVLDRVKGAAHFEVSIDRIVEIYEALSTLPGPAQPALVFVDRLSRKHRALYDESWSIRDFLETR